MSSGDKTRAWRITRDCFLTILAAGLAGCSGTPISAERIAREHANQIGRLVAHTDEASQFPRLPAVASAADYVRFAVLNHRQVMAAYEEWRASVEAITPARSLPDPQFTLQPDITSGNTLAVMPGLMFDFMTRSKRAAMGREMAAGSEVAYRKYAAAVLKTAADVRKAWIELAYVNAALRLRADAVTQVNQALAVANASYSTGSGMATLDVQLGLFNRTAEVQSKIGALEDRRRQARVRFKAALGLAPEAADPSYPDFELRPTQLPSEPALWAAAERANPELATMRAMVDMAVADVEVARKSRTPDFGAGVMYDSMASPLPVRPNASVTLPIWRDKIAAIIAGAEAKRSAALARVEAERINLAAELAQMVYMVRESDRMIAFIDGTALPNLDHSLASAEAGYQSGMVAAGMIPETRLMAIDMRLERLDALREREAAVTDLLFMMAAVAPADAPLL